MSTKKNSEKKVIPPGQPRMEIPNPRILDHAQQYRMVAEDLFYRKGGPNPNVVPLFTCCSLALELFVKALNAENLYNNLSLPFGTFDKRFPQVTAKSRSSDHTLSRLFQKVSEPARQRLEAVFKELPPIVGGTTLVDLLTRYDTLFVDSRYAFETDKISLEGSINDLVRLVSWFGGQLEAMPRERIFDEPNSILKHPGRVLGDTIVLDSGEILPEESIVEVEVVDGSVPGELGVVEAGGRIKFDWPDAILEGTKVTVEVTGKLLSLDKIDPAFRIGDRAVSGGVPDLGVNHDHYLYGDSKADDR